VEVFGVRLDQHSLFREKLQRDFTGTLDGKLRYAWSRSGFLQGSGKGEFSIFDGRFFLSQPFMDLNSVDFRRIDVQMVLSKNKISLDRFVFEGQQMGGTASGNIYLDSIFEKSNLELTVSVKPTHNFLMEKRELFDAARFLANQLKEDHFTLNVRGTIAQPRVRFI
jgi:type II secretion system protein N